jgi:hypothetical protein
MDQLAIFAAVIAFGCLSFIVLGWLGDWYDRKEREARTKDGPRWR